jgi:1-aminocyclopropane-1-carboxylate deaminase
LEPKGGCTIEVLRLDLIHPEYGGNKWFKLKYNIKNALSAGAKKVITLGGANSNHIAACAAFCATNGINSVGIIRGQNEHTETKTLQIARESGMELRFISRELYSARNNAAFIDFLNSEFANFYFIPEGGSNKAGVEGCMEILQKEMNHDYVFCGCGTATTYAGILLSAQKHQIITGISVLKGKNQLPQQAVNFATEVCPYNHFEVAGNEVLEQASINLHSIISSYAFSGYAHFDEELITYKRSFEKRYPISLDYVYNNKLFYAVDDLINKGKIRHRSRILIIHSGGLQGNADFEKRYDLVIPED